MDAHAPARRRFGKSDQSGGAPDLIANGDSGRAMYSTPLYCVSCEVFGAEDACWVCGGPLVADLSVRPKWVNSHSWSAGRTHFLWRAGVTVECGPLVDDLL